MMVVVMMMMMMMMTTRCAVYVLCPFALHLLAGTHRSREGLANTILVMWSV
jgi:hypothetical protein